MEETLRERGRDEPIGTVAVYYLIHEDDPAARKTIRAQLTRILQHAYPKVYDLFELQEIRDACAAFEAEYEVYAVPPIQVTLDGNYNPQTRALTDAAVRYQGTPTLDPALYDEGWLTPDRAAELNDRLQTAYAYLCGYATVRFRQWYDPEMFYRDDE